MPPSGQGTVAKREFCSSPFLPSVAGFCCVYGVKEQPVVDLEHSKADREAFHGQAVDFSGVLFAMKFFLGIMGFKPSFLLLHPSLFEIEPQSQKQQLYPRIPFPGCQESAESKVVLYQSKGSLSFSFCFATL